MLDWFAIIRDSEECNDSKIQPAKTVLYYCPHLLHSLVSRIISDYNGFKGVLRERARERNMHGGSPGTAVFCPAGTIENSPAIYCRGF